MARVRVQQILVRVLVQQILVRVLVQVQAPQVQVLAPQVQVQVLLQLVLLRGLELLHRVQEMQQERVPVAEPMRRHAKDLRAPFQEISSSQGFSTGSRMLLDPQAWCSAKRRFLSLYKKEGTTVQDSGTLISTMDNSNQGNCLPVLLSAMCNLLRVITEPCKWCPKFCQGHSTGSM